MDDRELDLTEAQKAIKSKYPPITKKYECKWNQTHSLFRMCHATPATKLHLPLRQSFVIDTTCRPVEVCGLFLIFNYSNIYLF